LPKVKLEISDGSFMHHPPIKQEMTVGDDDLAHQPSSPNGIVIVKEPSHMCFACPKAFTHKWMLDRHTLTHTGEQPFACSLCLRRFSLQASCLRHVRHVHKDAEGLIGNYVIRIDAINVAVNVANTQ
jgi:uncharacterized Zn-finger protein